MKDNKYKFLVCGIFVCAIVVASLTALMTGIRTKEVVFRYVRFPGAMMQTHNDKLRCHELSRRAMLEMFQTLKREDIALKVFSDLKASPGIGGDTGSKERLWNEIRRVEFFIDNQSADSNPINGRFVVRSSSDARASAIAGKYVELLRQLVDDEIRMRVDKSTMSYYSDYHVKGRELSSLESRLHGKDVGEADRQALVKSIGRVKVEMDKIAVELESQKERIRKDTGGSSNSLAIDCEFKRCACL